MVRHRQSCFAAVAAVVVVVVFRFRFCLLFFSVVQSMSYWAFSRNSNKAGQLSSGSQGGLVEASGWPR